MGCLAGALLAWTATSRTPQMIMGIAVLVISNLLVLAGETVARPWVNVSKYVGGDDAKQIGADEARFGYEALTRRQNELARQWCADAVQLNPKEAGYWYNLGIANERLSKRSEAIAAYQKACELAPADKSYQSALDGMRTN